MDSKYNCIRLGGRLRHSNLSESEKHPFILPKNSHFSKLVIDAYHPRGLHSLWRTLGVSGKIDETSFKENAWSTYPYV